MACSIAPSDSISIRTTSPDCRNCFGSIDMPTPLGVDVRRDAQVLRIGHLVGGRDPRAPRAEAVGALGARPLRLAALQVARADVVGDGVAGDLRVGAHDDDELAL